MMTKYLESDLYEPIQKFLIEQGYCVRGEVKDCDITAMKQDELVIVELKRSFQLKLVYQAIERQKADAFVYVAIPRPQKGQKSKEWKNILELLKRLELGLITVALDSEIHFVEVILTPGMGRRLKNKKKDSEIRGELVARKGDFNIGGTNKRKIMTAYREKCVELACLMENEESVSLKEFYELGLEKKISGVMGKNFYHWFERTAKGAYRLSDKGKEALESHDFDELVQFYRKKALQTKTSK